MTRSMASESEGAYVECGSQANGTCEKRKTEKKLIETKSVIMCKEK